MVAEFEWIRRPFTEQDGDICIRHYLVDPCGQVRADVDEPQGGRISYVADLYWSDDRYSNWVSLSLAKSHVETRYLALLANNFAKQKKAKPHDLQKAKTTRPSRGPAEKSNGLG